MAESMICCRKSAAMFALRRFTASRSASAWAQLSARSRPSAPARASSLTLDFLHARIHQGEESRLIDRIEPGGDHVALLVFAAGRGAGGGPLARFAALGGGFVVEALADFAVNFFFSLSGGGETSMTMMSIRFLKPFG